MVATHSVHYLAMDIDTGGASRFWTSEAPVIASARKLVIDGQLADAEKILAPLAAKDDVADEGLQVISWIRWDYSLDEAQLLKKIRASLPKATAADIDRWREQKQYQFRVLDGQVRYFRSEPGNLIRFCGEAKAIKGPDKPEHWKLTDHISRVIKAADEQRRPDVVPMRHRMDYVLTVNANATGMKKGSRLRVWLPFPQVYRQQSKVYLVSTEPANGQISPEGVPHRCVYFEKQVEDPGVALSFKVSFEYLTTAWCPKLDESQARITLNGEVLRNYLGERPPHMVFAPELKEAAAEALKEEKSDNPLLRAKAFFRWISKNIPWNSEEEYGIVPSTVKRGLARRRGDCGIQSMIFICMCRSAGIPARWQSGWETKRNNNSMHDWSEIHLEPWGWLPVDASYGLQESDDPRVREFYLGHTDSYRLIINTDYGKALWPAKHSVRSEPMDFQRGEVEMDGRNLYFSEWDWDMTIKWLDEGP